MKTLIPGLARFGVRVDPGNGETSDATMDPWRVPMIVRVTEGENRSPICSTIRRGVAGGEG